MKTPKAPDPFETATAQSGMNRDTAITQQFLNMVNQVTPQGTLTYEQTGTGGFTDAQGNWVETPTFTATTTLTPEQDRIRRESEAAQGNLAQIAKQQSSFLGNYLGKGIDTSGLTGLRSDFGPGFDASFSTNIGGGYNTRFGRNIGGNYTDTYAGADDFSADRQRYEDALWQRTAGERDQARSGLETQLINRGLRPGTAAWDSEMNRLAASETDARLATLLAGGDEQARMVGMARDAAMFGNQANLAKAQFGREGQLAQNSAALAQAGFGRESQAMSNSALAQQAGFQNQARAQGMQELFAQRNQPINEIAALLSGSQVSMPQFNSTPQTGVAGVDYTGLVNQKYQSELAASQSAMGGLFGLLGTGLSLFSDSRLKENVKRIGETDGGTPIYTYNYVWGGPTQMGVMAQEAPEDAVSEHESGYLMVDYGKVY
jgi:hypothetical protein